MRLEPRQDVTLFAQLAWPIGAILLTLAIASLLVLIAGASPFTVFWQVLVGAAGSQFALLETLTRATPLIFTGLAVAVAFRAKLWNIGAVMTVVLGTGAVMLPSL
ncbi:MAG: ABC transporter permease, partial [Pseudomonadota bacterium]